MPRRVGRCDVDLVLLLRVGKEWSGLSSHFFKSFFVVHVERKTCVRLSKGVEGGCVRLQCISDVQRIVRSRVRAERAFLRISSR